ncbi:MAG: hypothetical protein CMJ78_08435 [Planctomycetaceae bacterium]|nr:hypothetical protein [Planctomycetaceae bacterium]
MLTRESEDYVVASLIMAANSGALRAEGQALVAMYADRDELQGVVAEMRELPRGMEFTIAPKLTALIKEKGTFVSSVLDLFHDVKKEIWINDVRFAKDVQLENVKIQGKVAKGKIRMTLEGRSGSEDVIFRKIKDKWYLNYAPSA